MGIKTKVVTSVVVGTTATIIITRGISFYKKKEMALKELQDNNQTMWDAISNIHVEGMRITTLERYVEVSTNIKNAKTNKSLATALNDMNEVRRVLTGILKEQKAKGIGKPYTESQLKDISEYEVDSETGVIINEDYINDFEKTVNSLKEEYSMQQVAKTYGIDVSGKERVCCADVANCERHLEIMRERLAAKKANKVVENAYKTLESEGKHVAVDELVLDTTVEVSTNDNQDEPEKKEKKKKKGKKGKKKDKDKKKKHSEHQDEDGEKKEKKKKTKAMKEIGELEPQEEVEYLLNNTIENPLEAILKKGNETKKQPKETNEMNTRKESNVQGEETKEMSMSASDYGYDESEADIFSLGGYIDDEDDDDEEEFQFNQEEFLARIAAAASEDENEDDEDEDEVVNPLAGVDVFGLVPEDEDDEEEGKDESDDEPEENDSHQEDDETDDEDDDEEESVDDDRSGMKLGDWGFTNNKNRRVNGKEQHDMKSALASMMRSNATMGEDDSDDDDDDDDDGEQPPKSTEEIARELNAILEEDDDEETSSEPLSPEEEEELERKNYELYQKDAEEKYKELIKMNAGYAYEIKKQREASGIEPEYVYVPYLDTEHNPVKSKSKSSSTGDDDDDDDDTKVVERSAKCEVIDREKGLVLTPYGGLVLLGRQYFEDSKGKENETGSNESSTEDQAVTEENDETVAENINTTVVEDKEEPGVVFIGFDTSMSERPDDTTTDETKEDTDGLEGSVCEGLGGSSNVPTSTDTEERSRDYDEVDSEVETSDVSTDTESIDVENDDLKGGDAEEDDVDNQETECEPEDYDDDIEETDDDDNDDVLIRIIEKLSSLYDNSPEFEFNIFRKFVKDLDDLNYYKISPEDYDDAIATLSVISNMRDENLKVRKLNTLIEAFNGQYAGVLRRERNKRNASNR